jgi:hypothetical protein
MGLHAPHNRWKWFPVSSRNEVLVKNSAFQLGVLAQQMGKHCQLRMCPVGTTGFAHALADWTGEQS